MLAEIGGCARANTAVLPDRISKIDSGQSMTAVERSSWSSGICREGGHGAKKQQRNLPLAPKGSGGNGLHEGNRNLVCFHSQAKVKLTSTPCPLRVAHYCMGFAPQFREIRALVFAFCSSWLIPQVLKMDTVSRQRSSFGSTNMVL